MNTISSSSRYPFTQSQWQELEQQALIYKYMASGIPIPSDLLLPIRRSFFLSSTQPTPMGWASACYHIGGYGVGRKGAEDTEPWRCRRTDGKKWRCSKEAYADSKYCERHMHRGKNRSRKHVEFSLNPAPTAKNTATINATSPYPLLYPHSSWELRPLGVGEPRQRESEEERGKHCFVLGTDFRTERPVKERDFFSFDAGGERNSSSSSRSTNQGSSSSANSYSTTQLSISVPMGLHDFPQ